MKNNRGPHKGGRGFGEPRRVFGAPAEDAYRLPSAASTPEELLLLGALKRCGGDGVPSKSLQREAGKERRRQSGRAAKEAEADRQFALRQQKRRAKHRGH